MPMKDFMKAFKHYVVVEKIKSTNHYKDLLHIFPPISCWE